MGETSNNRTPIVALDIGTTKVCAIVGQKNEHGQVEILGLAKVDSDGVRRGVVSNIEKTINAISEVTSRVKRQLGADFTHVHVGIAGQHIKTLSRRGMVTRDNDLTEISYEDMERLMNDMYKMALPPGDKILHIIPQDFTVDNEGDIDDPIGMSGIQLEANFHVITAQSSAIKNIVKCVERTGLKVANLSLEPLASATAVLRQEEKDAGVALVDIGGGTTDICIFTEGTVRHTAVIPFGGNVISKDIKTGCNIMLPQAEKLKTKFGSAMPEEVYDNRIITIPGLQGHDPKEISEKNLSRIIQARVEEILDYVVWEIKRSGLENKLTAGIVLTGGTSQLRHIDLLTEYHTGMPTRIGLPTEQLAQGFSAQLSKPNYATVIGLLKEAIEDVECGKIVYQVEEQIEETIEEDMADEKDVKNKNRNWLDEWFQKTKKWFDAETDAEF